MIPASGVRLPWKTGFEIELLAPPGISREDIAQAVAKRIGGSAGRFFHPQSEPSKVPGHPVFENLTLGFRVLADDGQPYASFVVTPKHPPEPQKLRSPNNSMQHAA